MTSIQLADREKVLFSDWLHQREKTLLEEVEVVKTLKSKLNDVTEVTPKLKQRPDVEVEVKAISPKINEDAFSWVDIIKNELKHFSHPIPSGEIVKRLLNNHSLAQKGKRFITKAVTSKLWLLQERKEVVKGKENGKYVYSLKK